MSDAAGVAVATVVAVARLLTNDPFANLLFVFGIDSRQDTL